MNEVQQTMDAIRGILAENLEAVYESLGEPRAALEQNQTVINRHENRIVDAQGKVEGLQEKISKEEDAYRAWVASSDKGSPSSSRQNIKRWQGQIEDRKYEIELCSAAKKEAVAERIDLEYNLSAALHVALKGIKAQMEDKFNEYLQLANDMQSAWVGDVAAFCEAKGLSRSHPDFSPGEVPKEEELLSPRKPHGIVGAWVQGLLNAIDHGDSMQALKYELEREAQERNETLRATSLEVTKVEAESEVIR
jgi:hypothetical protein